MRSITFIKERFHKLSKLRYYISSEVHLQNVDGSNLRLNTMMSRLIGQCEHRYGIEIDLWLTGATRANIIPGGTHTVR